MASNLWHKYGPRRLAQVAMAAAIFLGADGSALAQLQSLSDSDMSVVTGQALLVADKIAASAISGTPTADSGLTFYRMGLDATLGFNANINKFQLGCGGVNDILVKGCDIDLSNVSFMGNSGNNPGAAVTSDFNLTRPYIELAISGDGTGQRQLVGMNIGSQVANGYLSIGNVYANGATNKETGTSCTVSGGSNGTGCESGVNMFSGYMQPVLFGSAWGNCTGLAWFSCVFSGTNHNGQAHGSGTYVACLSSSGTYGCGDLGPAGGTVASPITGTRLVSAYTSAANIPSDAGALTITPTMNLTQLMAYIHGLAFNGVPNFGISFQRQQVAYPTYAKTGFNPTANTGWWMNAPSNVNITVPNVQGPDVGIGALFAPINVTNLDMKSTPTANCYGSYKFC